MSARKADPVLAAWDRLQAAERAHAAAYDAIDKARASGASEEDLKRYEVAEKRTRLKWRAAMKAMGTTRATTAAGVISKLKLIQLELRDGLSGYGDAILASAIKDLSRIGRRSR